MTHVLVILINTSCIQVKFTLNGENAHGHVPLWLLIQYCRACSPLPNHTLEYAGDSISKYAGDSGHVNYQIQVELNLRL